MSKASSIRNVLRMLGRLDFLGRGVSRANVPERGAGGGECSKIPIHSQEGFSLLAVLIAVMIVGVPQ